MLVFLILKPLQNPPKTSQDPLQNPPRPFQIDPKSNLEAFNMGKQNYVPKCLCFEAKKLVQNAPRAS